MENGSVFLLFFDIILVSLFLLFLTICSLCILHIAFISFSHSFHFSFSLVLLFVCNFLTFSFIFLSFFPFFPPVIPLCFLCFQQTPIFIHYFFYSIRFLPVFSPSLLQWVTLCLSSSVFMFFLVLSDCPFVCLFGVVHLSPCISLPVYIFVYLSMRFPSISLYIYLLKYLKTSFFVASFRSITLTTVLLATNLPSPAAYKAVKTLNRISVARTRRQKARAQRTLEGII